MTMLIRNLIHQGVVPVKPSDTVAHALDLLYEVRVRHLPVVDRSGMLVGLVSEEQLLNASGPEALVDTLLGLEPISGSPDLHIFEATKIIITHDLTVLPIASDDHKYLGAVRLHDIFNRFAKMLSTNESGAILALEVASKDYSLSKLVYSIEQNDVKILSIATETPEEDGVLRVTLKLDAKDTSRVRHVLEHQGYRIVAAFSEEGTDEDLRYRVEEFMRYLEV
ncbi:MAG: CBS domain-containing protein [Rhodothermales bacterium]